MALVSAFLRIGNHAKYGTLFHSPSIMAAVHGQRIEDVKVNVEAAYKFREGVRQNWAGRHATPDATPRRAAGRHAMPCHASPTTLSPAPRPTL